MDSPHTVEELDFHRFLLTSGKSLETARSYATNIRYFFRWCDEHEIEPQEADRRTIEHYVADERASVAASTARNRLFAVRCYFDYLHSRSATVDGIMVNPTAGLTVKRPRTLPKQPVSVTDQRRLAFSTRSTRDEAIVMLLVDTGIRIGEVVAIKVEDVRWEEGAVTINGKGSKQRDVWPNEDVMALLRQVAGERKRGPMFLTRDGKPLTRERARKNFARLAQRARVDCHPHKLRATFANNFLCGGGDLGALREAMGHSDISTTAHYAAATEKDRARETVRRLNLARRIFE